MRLAFNTRDLERLMRSLFATFVVLAHAALIFSAFHHRVVPAKERVVHTLVETESEFVDKGDGEKGLTKCLSDYQGFGFSVFYGVVMKVGKGYPADRAGLKAGDIISLNGVQLNSSVTEGNPLTFDVVRNKQRLRMTMKREKVCLTK